MSNNIKVPGNAGNRKKVNQVSKKKDILKNKVLNKGKEVKVIQKSNKLPLVKDPYKRLDKKEAKKSKPADAKMIESIYGTTDMQKKIREVIQDLASNEVVTTYLSQRVSKNSIDIVRELVKPKTDDEMAEDLDMKINSVRRIVNILHTYGLTNYRREKNKEGWESFYWYINIRKIPDFLNYVVSVSSTKLNIDEKCNDYFVCSYCYNENRMIFNFDSAFEADFKCVNCGGPMIRISKLQAIDLAKNKLKIEGLKVKK